MEAKVFRKKCYTLLAILVITAFSQTTAQTENRRNYSDPDLVQQRRSSTAEFNQSGYYSNNRGNQAVRVDYYNNGNHFRYGRRRSFYNPRPRFRNNYLLPIGARVNFIPHHAIAFRTYQRDYFYANGNFYTPAHRGYRVVRTPIGARISILPRRANKVFVNRNIFYQLDDLYLAAFVNRRGMVMYEITGCV